MCCIKHYKMCSFCSATLPVWWCWIRFNTGQPLQIFDVHSYTSRHTVVCCVAQENGVCTNGVNILTGTIKSQFSHICISVMSYPNCTKFTEELASMQCEATFKFKTRSLKPLRRYKSTNFRKSLFFSFSFCTLCKNRNYSCMCAPI